MQYKVVSGDTLFKISQKFYGSGSHYMAIANANNISNPNYIQVGQVLNIPGQEKYGPLMPGEAKMTPPSWSTAPNVVPTPTPTPSPASSSTGGISMMTVGLIIGAAVLGYFVFTKMMGSDEEVSSPAQEATNV